MGDLTEWIRVHRRAEATPVPAPAPGGGAVVPSTPKALAPERDLRLDQLLWPQWSVLTTLWLPYSLVAGFLALAALGGVGAWRHFRRTAHRG
jgi:hypothetical protein